MTILADEVVMINGNEDKMPQTEELIDAYSLPLGYPMYPLFQDQSFKTTSSGHNAAQESQSGTIGTLVTIHTFSNGKQLSTHRYHEARSHRRILFKEYGQPLHNLTDQRLCLRSINQAISGKLSFNRMRQYHINIYYDR